MSFNFDIFYSIKRQEAQATQQMRRHSRNSECIKFKPNKDDGIDDFSFWLINAFGFVWNRWWYCSMIDIWRNRAEDKQIWASFIQLTGVRYATHFAADISAPATQRWHKEPKQPQQPKPNGHDRPLNGVSIIDSYSITLLSITFVIRMRRHSRSSTNNFRLLTNDVTPDANYEMYFLSYRNCGEIVNSLIRIQCIKFTLRLHTFCFKFSVNVAGMIKITK